MKKLLRVIKEGLNALVLYKNPWVYCFERCRLYSSNKKVTVALRNGPRYTIHTNTNEAVMLNEIWHLRIYDPLMSFIHKDSVVIDIGANNGIFSIKAALCAPGVRVISCEPFPSNLELLKENISANGLGGRVIVFPYAISGKRGEVDFFYHDRDSGGGSFHKHGNRSAMKSTKVRTITLADIFRDHKIEVCDFLKMDCEGAEEEILYNVSRELMMRIKTMTIEWHDDLSKYGFVHFVNFLEDNGYKTDFNKKTGTLYAYR